MNEYDNGISGLGPAEFITIVYVLLIVLILIVIDVVGMWKIFTKAGKPGWAAIIPIYNYIVLMEIIGKPLWWVIMLLLPCVNLVFGILVYIELAKCFGKDAFYGVLLFLFRTIMIPVLGFSDAQYTPPSEQSM